MKSINNIESARCGYQRSPVDCVRHGRMHRGHHDGSWMHRITPDNLPSYLFLFLHIFLYIFSSSSSFYRDYGYFHGDWVVVSHGGNAGGGMGNPHIGTIRKSANPQIGHKNFVEDEAPDSAVRRVGDLMKEIDGIRAASSRIGGRTGMADCIGASSLAGDGHWPIRAGSFVALWAPKHTLIDGPK